MPKKKNIEISVTAVFAGKEALQNVFVELILQRRRMDATPTETGHKSTSAAVLHIDAHEKKSYTDAKVFSDVQALKGENA